MYFRPNHITKRQLMRLPFLIISFFAGLHSVFGQSMTDFSKLYLDDLYNKSSEIRQYKIEDNDFNDLESIGRSIGEADIVLLGEPSHGDGGAIQMKTRLVKYLHEHKGFDVLLFEADLFAIMYGFSDLEDPQEIERFAKGSIYTCWSESAVTKELWRYYSSQLKGPNPIRIGGFDVRHAGRYSKDRLVKYLDNLLISIDFNTSTDSYLRFKKDLSYFLKEEFRSRKDSVDPKNFNLEVDRIEEAVRYSMLDTKERNLSMIEVNNIRNLFAYLIDGKSRDAIMAQNFILLSKYIFPGQKILVWSHNNHNVLDVNTYASYSKEFADNWYMNDTYRGFTYFGTDIFREFGDRVYSLAITSGSGNYSPAFFGKDYFHADFTKVAKIPSSREESLEGYLQNRKSGNRFITLPGAQGRPSGYPWFLGRLLDLNFEAKMDYTSSFNGIIYLERTVDLNGN